jgi:hypothetical protein
VSEAQIRERYLESGTTKIELRRDDPELRLQVRGTNFPLLMMFVWGSSFLCIALYMRTFRRGIGDGVRKWTLVGLLAFLMLLHIAQFLPFVMNVTEPWIVAAFWEITGRALALTLPGGVAALWLLSAGVVALFYWVAQRQFRRAEFVVVELPPLC